MLPQYIYLVNCDDSLIAVTPFRLPQTLVILGIVSIGLFGSYGCKKIEHGCSPTPHCVLVCQLTMTHCRLPF